MKVKLPKTIKVGGLDIALEIGGAVEKELSSKIVYGDYNQGMRRIRLTNNFDPERLSNSFLHEILHAIDDRYNNYQLTEETTEALANGLYEVLTQLEIEFSK
jgi:hypothetical protein